MSASDIVSPMRVLMMYTSGKKCEPTINLTSCSIGKARANLHTERKKHINKASIVIHAG